MHKNFTLSDEKDAHSVFSDQHRKKNAMQPKNETLKKILQFAATCKTEKIADNRFTEIYLN